jgi:hypothetical protein
MNPVLHFISFHLFNHGQTGWMGRLSCISSGLEYEVTWALSVGGSYSIRPASQDIHFFVLYPFMAYGYPFLTVYFSPSIFTRFLGWPFAK